MTQLQKLNDYKFGYETTVVRVDEHRYGSFMHWYPNVQTLYPHIQPLLKATPFSDKSFLHTVL